MMSDWQVGDLAVKSGCSCGGHIKPPTARLADVAVYHVVGVRWPKSGRFRNCKAAAA